MSVNSYLSLLLCIAVLYLIKFVVAIKILCVCVLCVVMMSLTKILSFYAMLIVVVWRRKCCVKCVACDGKCL